MTSFIHSHKGIAQKTWETQTKDGTNERMKARHSSHHGSHAGTEAVLWCVLEGSDNILLTSTRHNSVTIKKAPCTVGHCFLSWHHARALTHHNGMTSTVCNKSQITSYFCCCSILFKIFICTFHGDQTIAVLFNSGHMFIISSFTHILNGITVISVFVHMFLCECVCSNVSVFILCMKTQCLSINASSE